MGSLYITSYLRSKGIDASVCDLNVERRNWEKKLIEELSERPKIVGLSSNFVNYSSSLKIAEICKNNDVETVVAGGPLPTTAPHLYLKHDIDAAVIGEGEEIFFDFISKGQKAKGIALKRNDRVIYTGSKNRIKNLDNLPFPAYDILDIKKYRSYSLGKRPTLGLITSRGCPFNCVFCDHKVFGRHWRARNPENVIDEVRWQVNELGAKGINIYDENICVDLKRFELLLDLMISEKFDLSWKMANFRADAVNETIAQKLADAGCKKIVISPESGSQDTLDRIGKGLDLKNLPRAVDMLKSQGILVQTSFILGFPFETKEDMEDTINFAIELNPDICDFNKLMVFPGTDLHKSLGDQSLKDLFMDYDDINNSSLENSHYNGLFKKAYKKFYLRPSKLFDVLTKLSFVEVIDLVRYSLAIGAF
jgi:anaerobic magnesium-protoporphyrin IX monomethyl ester cyclase